MTTKICTGCRQEKALTAFVMDRKRQRRKSRCLACTSAAAKAWRHRNPDYERERYASDKIGTRERHLVRKYGVTLADYNRMLHAQDSKCSICSAPEAEQHKGVFHVDHCHTTGAVRGLLCRGCNHILGHVKDDPGTLQRAIAYLTKSPNSSAARSSRLKASK